MTDYQIRNLLNSDADCQILYSWRYSSNVKQMCLNQNVPSFPEFRSNFHNYFLYYCPIFLVVNGVEVFYFAIYPDDNNTKNFQISVMSNPNIVSQGKGTFYLKICLTHVSLNQYNLKHLVANIKEENIKSIKIFTNNGFKLIEKYEVNGNLIHKYIYELTE